MSWNRKDLLFLSIINEYGEKQVNQLIKQASQFYLKLKNKPELIVFGNYDLLTHIFTWDSTIKNILFKMIQNNYMSVFGDDSTLKKLFKTRIEFSLQYRNTIAYLLKIVNAAYHVVRFKIQNKIVFGLVKLPLKDTLDFELFDHLMLSYRQYHLLKKNTVKKTIKRRY